ncbi:MAG: DHA2 family efflux MFS transporter permease subunit [Alphaproteobacteria bacterium]|nr:DHA2 family efflux MFS transporter permease subunit [Alphaproteobacteria bacterium]
MTAATAHKVPPYRGLVSVSAMMATTMQAIDGTIANVALPHMQASLSATPDQIAWVLTSYIVASAVMIPLTGFLALRYGRKSIYLMSIAGFTVASALCGLATTLDEMLIFRALQGVLGAGLIPLSQSIMLDSYPDHERGKAMAVWGVGVMVGPILGPTLGGYLTEFYNWRWIFYINVPFGVLSFIGLALFSQDTPLDKERKFAGYGYAALALGIMAFQLMLDRGERQDWFQSSEIVLWAVLAFTGFYLFIHHMVFSKNPFVHREILRDRNFVAGSMFYFCVAMVLYTSMALVPVMLQNLMGYPVLTTGMIIAPRGFGMMIGMTTVGRLAQRGGDPRLFIIIGLSLTIFTLWEMSRFNLYTGEFELIWIGVVQGIGIGMTFVSLNLISYSTLSTRLRTEAASFANTMRTFGSSMGIAVVFAFQTRASQLNHATLSELFTPFNNAFNYLKPDVWDLGSAAGRAAIDAELTRQASMMAFTTDFQLVMIATICILPLLLLVCLPKNMMAPPPEAAVE